jgi:uncharacterized membrane protein YhiD involved in acid resistance
MLANLVKNWKTTSAGLTIIVTGAVHLVFAIQSKSITEADCTTTIVSIVTGIGLLAAGDAGATPPTT